jgi:hypothetical protein
MAQKEAIPRFQEIFSSRVFSDSKIRHSAYQSVEETLHNMFLNFSGTVHITVNPELDTKVLYSDGEPMRTITWVVPFLDDVLKRCQYIELDASFKAAFPYVYVVPQAIIDNESVPLGFVIGPTERSELFEEFYQCVKATSSMYPDLLRIPVVTDEGSALQFFCKKLKFRQFLCFKHVLNKFGNLSPLYFLAKRVLYSTTRAQLELKLPLILEIAKDVFTSTIDHLHQFEDIIGYRFDAEKGTWSQFLTPFEPNYFWNRVAQNIGLTTNHAERFPRIMNHGASKDQACS